MQRPTAAQEAMDSWMNASAGRGRVQELDRDGQEDEVDGRGEGEDGEDTVVADRIDPTAAAPWWIGQEEAVHALQQRVRGGDDSIAGRWPATRRNARSHPSRGRSAPASGAPGRAPAAIHDARAPQQPSGPPPRATTKPQARCRTRWRARGRRGIASAGGAAARSARPRAGPWRRRKALPPRRGDARRRAPARGERSAGPRGSPPAPPAWPRPRRPGRWRIRALRPHGCAGAAARPASRWAGRGGGAAPAASPRPPPGSRPRCPAGRAAKRTAERGRCRAPSPGRTARLPAVLAATEAPVSGSGGERGLAAARRVLGHGDAVFVYRAVACFSGS